MAIKRGSSYEGAFSHRGKRYRRSFPTEQEADLWVLENKARVIRGEPVDMGERVRRRADGLPHTLSELVDHVYTTHWAPMAGGEKALTNARSIVSIIGPNTPIARLTKADIDRARAGLLEGGNAPSTVNRKVAALSKAMSEAEDLGIVERKPKFSRYKESEHRIRRFTPEEERLTLLFFERISQQDMHDYTLIGLDTGLRQGEILALHHADCEGEHVHVWGVGASGQRSKSGKSRTVKMTRRVQEVMKRRKRMSNTAQVFPDLNRWGIRHYWKRLRETLNLQDDKHFVPHILRHEFCSRLAANKVNAAYIQALAGHSSMAVTQRYIHLFGGDLDGAIDALEAKTDADTAEALSALAKLPQELLSKLQEAGILRVPELS